MNILSRDWGARKTGESQVGNDSVDVSTASLSDGPSGEGPTDESQVSNALGSAGQGSNDTATRIRIRMYCEEVETLFVRAGADCPDAVPFMYQRACKYGMPSERWMKAERQIEVWLQKNYGMKATRIAHYLIAYHKIDPRMKPFLINLARKVKAKYRMRRHRGRIEVRVVDGKEQVVNLGHEPEIGREAAFS